MSRTAAGTATTRKNGSGEIEYDVSRVPFPLERDPEIAGVKPKRGKPVKHRKPLPPEYDRYRLYSEEDLGEFPPVDWFIKGYLAIGELTVFYGKGDTFKSFVALDWSCWLARHDVLVIYIVSEGASGAKARIAAWRAKHGVSELPNLLLMPSNVSLHDADDVETFIGAMAEQLDRRQPGLIVVDTLARNFVGGNESSPQDMGMFVEGLETLRREFKTAVLVIHHTTKDGRSERGTESLRNASFAMFEFERVNQARQVKVVCDRMKDAEPPKPVTVRPALVHLPELGEDVSSLVADWPYDGRDSRPQQSPARRESGASLSRRNRTVLGAVAGASEGANPAYLAKRLRISLRTVSRVVNALAAAGFLEAEGTTRDRRFTITAAGREVLE